MPCGHHVDLVIHTALPVEVPCYKPVEIQACIDTSCSRFRYPFEVCGEFVWLGKCDHHGPWGRKKAWPRLFVSQRQNSLRCGYTFPHWCAEGLCLPLRPNITAGRCARLNPKPLNPTKPSTHSLDSRLQTGISTGPLTSFHFRQHVQALSPLLSSPRKPDLIS